MKHIGKLAAMSAMAMALGAGPSLSGDAPTSPTFTIPEADPIRGREMFVTKGCVMCHAVNGAGGKSAPPLNAPAQETADLLDVIARMWAGAYAMAELQAIEMGYQIELTGQEMADLAAFVSDQSAQAEFSVADIPEPMREWLIDAPYWQEDEWPERFESGDWEFPPY